MKISKNSRNVVVVSHKVVHQPDDDIILYFNNNKYQNVLHIMHSFANATDRKSRYVWYKAGAIYQEQVTTDFKQFPEPVIYLKEFYYTTKWVLRSKIVWDIFIGLDGLCVFFGNALRSIGRIRKTIFWSIDFVPTARFKEGLKNKIYHIINTHSYKNTDEMWDLSPRMAEGRAEFLGIKKTDYKKHRIVQYGLWLDRIKQIPYKNCEKNTLVFMGNLSEYQGLQLVIKALPQIAKKFPNIKIKIIGEGNYTPEIKKLAKTLGVSSRCSFLGRMKDTIQMEKEISKAAVAVATYLHEMDNVSRYADPGKIKTYLACGLPVVLTDVPWNAREILENKCGLIVEESEKDIINKISSLLTPAKNDSFRKNAIKYAQTFNFSEIFQKAL